MCRVFLDESGNLGKKDRYFIISAVVCSDNHGANGVNRMKRIMKRACSGFSDSNEPLSEIHSTTLSFSQKQKLLNEIEYRDDHEFFIIIADKKHLDNFKLQDKNLIYNYLAGILVRRILNRHDDDLDLYFDERSTKIASRNSLLDYLRIRAHIDWGYNHELGIRLVDSKNVYCIQVADLVSNIFFKSYSRRQNQQHLINIISANIKCIEKFPYKKFGQ